MQTLESLPTQHQGRSPDTDPTGTTDPKAVGRDGAERRVAAIPVPVGSIGTVGSVSEPCTGTTASLLDRYRPALSRTHAVEPLAAAKEEKEEEASAFPQPDNLPLGFEVFEVDPAEVPTCKCGRTYASQSTSGVWPCSHCDDDYHARRRTEAFIREVHRIRKKTNRPRDP